MTLGGEVEIALQRAEEGEHALPFPANGSRGGPLVVVTGCAAVGHHAVDRGASAHDPGLLVAIAAARFGIALRRFAIKDAQVAPVMPWIEIGNDGVAVPDDLVFVSGRSVFPGFDQGNLEIRPRRKTAGNDAASRPTANDDVIVGCALAIAH
jgi:hypothetical protein